MRSMAGALPRAVGTRANAGVPKTPVPLSGAPATRLAATPVPTAGAPKVAAVRGSSRRREATGRSAAQAAVRTARPTGPEIPVGAVVHIVLIMSPTSSGDR